MKCNGDSYDAGHCPQCGGHKVGWPVTALCDACIQANEHAALQAARKHSQAAEAHRAKAERMH